MHRRTGKVPRTEARHRAYSVQGPISVRIPYICSVLFRTFMVQGAHSALCSTRPLGWFLNRTPFADLPRTSRKRALQPHPSSRLCGSLAVVVQPTLGLLHRLGKRWRRLRRSSGWQYPSLLGSASCPGYVTPLNCERRHISAYTRVVRVCPTPCTIAYRVRHGRALRHGAQLLCASSFLFLI